ncbi:MAG: hypothetical protein MK212_18280 [Saprospiraceae bacterium]|nr:hypothetical protein [Saprospiraceae bacterium]
MQILNKVLWEGRGRWQIVGASVGVFVGLFLLLFAVQVYIDAQSLMQGARDANILVLNKSRKAAEDSFAQQDLEDLRKQSFLEDISPIYSNQYTAAVSSNTLGFYSLLFFQTVPNQFLDIDTSSFTWSEEDPIVPVLISSDHLNLYNYGFAPSQGLPTIPEGALGAVDFKITVSGKNKKKDFQGLIYGVTRNVNSILVPKSFMDYTNAEFGDADKPAAQVIVSVDNPYSETLLTYLEEENLQVSRGGLIGGELRTTLQILVLLIIVIGLVIIGLSLLVFILNFQLLIAQAQGDIQLLIQLGYDDWRISRLLAKNLFRLFALIVLAVLVCLPLVKYWITSSFWTEGFQISFWVSWQVWLTALLFCALFVWVNLRSIQKTVRKLA